MADGIRVEGTAEWRKCAVNIKAAADRDLAKAVRKAIRDLAKPVGRFALDRGAEPMPASGGLAALITESGKIGVTAGMAGKNPKVTINLTSPKQGGASVKTMDAHGFVRHPVYADPAKDRKEWAWVRQGVESGTFTKAFEENADELADAVLSAVEDVLQDVTRGL